MNWDFTLRKEGGWIFWTLNRISKKSESSVDPTLRSFVPFSSTHIHVWVRTCVWLVELSIFYSWDPRQRENKKKRKCYIFTIYFILFFHRLKLSCPFYDRSTVSSRLSMEFVIQPQLRVTNSSVPQVYTRNPRPTYNGNSWKTDNFGVWDTTYFISPDSRFLYETRVSDLRPFSTGQVF